MALSGTIQGKFAGTVATNVKPVIEWKATQNVAKNQSTITSTLVFIKSNSYWYPFNLSGHSVTMNIGSYKQTASRTFDLRSKSREVVWTRTTTVNHNADGSLKIRLSASGNTGISNIGSYNFGEDVTINTIPRKSTMTIAPTTAEFGGTIKFTISKASAGFKHLINYNINGVGGSAVALTDSTTPTWTIPTDLMKHVPTETSAKINLWLDTYSGSTKIGVNSYSITANVPQGIAPSISAFSAKEASTRLAAFKLGSNSFLQANSQIQFSSSATAGSGAKLSSSKIEIIGVSSINSGSGVIDLSPLSTHSGSKIARLTVRDSRGRTATKDLNITINAYSPPKISKFTATRDKTNIKVNKSVTYSNIGSNTITYSLTKDGGIKVGDITHDKNDYVFAGYAEEKSFVFTLKVSDSLNSSSSVSNVGTGKQLMHIDKDNGFGIGKYRENGILDVGGNVYINGLLEIKKQADFLANVTVGGSATVSGSMSSKSLSTGDIDTNGRVIISGGKTWGSGGGLHLKNADVMGANGIYFNDPADAHGEGLMFPRTGTNTPDSGILTNNKFPEWDNMRVLDGTVYLNGRVISVENVTEALWQGGMHMMAGHRITPEKNINDCPNGWALVWVRWVGGKDAGYGYSWTYIHKRHSWGGGIYVPIAIGDDAYRTKYMYVQEGGKILAGNDANNKNGRDGAVLKGVYAW